MSIYSKDVVSPQVSELPLQGKNFDDIIMSDVENDLVLIARQTWIFLQKHLQQTTGLPFDRAELRDDKMHLAEITSPTNIGLALLSYVAVEQLGYEDRLIVIDHLKSLIISINSLKRRNGMFVNWHHIDDCKPVVYWPNSEQESKLEQESKIEEFISSVDNAWLAVGLIIAGEHFPELKCSIDTILNQMAFRDLFDETRGSFAGGIHQSGELTDYHYPSTYLSEARILYYVSYLLNQLSRENLQKYLDNFPSLSYGGSVFEILMPLLVFDEQGLSAHAILNLINLQREAGQEHGCWGYSPSDDPKSHYKEFGVGAYAENGFDVITPHALFLALPYATNEVLEILARLIGETQAWTENGFVDAVNVRENITSDSWLFLDQAMIFLAIYQFLIRDNFRKTIF